MWSYARDIFWFSPISFGYVAAGKDVQFFAIDRKKKLNPLHSNRLNLNYAKDRLQIVVYSLNIAWIIGGYKNIEGSAKIPLNSWILNKAFNTKMFFTSKNLQKEIPINETTNTIEEIYNLIKNNKISNTIKCLNLTRTRTKLTVTLSPICEPYGVFKIDSNKKLLKALQNVLTAVRDLHNHNFVHRDIRWPNILFDSQNYLLTDFECAALADEVLPEILRNYSNVEYPEMFTEEEKAYTKQVDLYLVGKLIEYIESDNIFEIDHKILDLIKPKRNVPNLFDYIDRNLTAQLVLDYLNKIKLDS